MTSTPRSARWASATAAAAAVTRGRTWDAIAAQTRAIERALGHASARVMVSSNKGQLGHTLAAAGAINAIAAALAIARGEVPPTTHYAVPDPECGLDYVPNAGRRARVGAALANAFAFGGHNVVLALRAHGAGMDR